MTRRKQGELIPIEKKILEEAESKPEGVFYGYEILDKLNAKHNATVYRALRRLEDRGYIESRWENSNGSLPNRRVYKIVGSDDE